ncbi:MAG: hypothetical protein KAT05_05755 [Spirochaetes bacterium]|nr:hypothetical protein [Spirochaetota bacterium]
MKKTILSIIFFNIFSIIFAEENIIVERIYFFKVIAFHKKHEIFCTKEPAGYYKYPQNIEGNNIYLTYEANKFYNQCKFDESFTIFTLFYPLNMWTNNKGEVFRLKKKYSPVIEKNRKRKNYPYGFGKN